MARWQDLVESEPAFAGEVKTRFDAQKHKLLATLRKDGSPRISGIETTFADGDVWLGMMPGSRKAQDLQRDGRFALHTSSVDPPEGDESSWLGDAKMSGVAVEEHDPEARNRVLGNAGDGVDPAGAGHVFRLDITAVVLTRVGDPADHLLIQTWQPGRGLWATKRA